MLTMRFPGVLARACRALVIPAAIPVGALSRLRPAP
jgi:hypothetical protein